MLQFGHKLASLHICNILRNKALSSGNVFKDSNQAGKHNQFYKVGYKNTCQRERARRHENIRDHQNNPCSRWQDNGQ